MLDDYEEGELYAYVKTNKKWYQFWMPKYLSVRAGNYTRIGAKINFNVRMGELMVSGQAEKGLMSGMIKGLPFPKDNNKNEG